MTEASALATVSSTSCWVSGGVPGTSALQSRTATRATSAPVAYGTIRPARTRPRIAPGVGSGPPPGGRSARRSPEVVARRLIRWSPRRGRAWAIHAGERALSRTPSRRQGPSDGSQTTCSAEPRRRALSSLVQLSWTFLSEAGPRRGARRPPRPSPRQSPRGLRRGPGPGGRGLDLSPVHRLGDASAIGGGVAPQPGRRCRPGRRASPSRRPGSRRRRPWSAGSFEREVAAQGHLRQVGDGQHGPRSEGVEYLCRGWPARTRLGDALRRGTGRVSWRTAGHAALRGWLAPTTYNRHHGFSRPSDEILTGSTRPRGSTNPDRRSCAAAGP